jgi:hypothetical protein
MTARATRKGFLELILESTVSERQHRKHSLFSAKEIVQSNAEQPCQERSECGLEMQATRQSRTIGK